MSDQWPGANGQSAVLFDLDGTLLDSVELIVRAFQHTTIIHLGAPVEREWVLPTIGQALPAVLEELAPAHGAALLTTYAAFIREHHASLTRLFPGATELLATLRQRGYRLGIVTSKRREIATLAFVDHGLDRLVDVVICLEDAPRSKPAPDPLLTAAARLGLRPAACLYVGDSTADLLSARAAGMACAAALWGAGSRADLLALRPAIILEELAELLATCVAGPTAD